MRERDLSEEELVIRISRARKPRNKRKSSHESRTTPSFNNSWVCGKISLRWLDEGV